MTPLQMLTGCVFGIGFAVCIVGVVQVWGEVHTAVDGLAIDGAVCAVAHTATTIDFGIGLLVACGLVHLVTWCGSHAAITDGSTDGRAIRGSAAFAAKLVFVLGLVVALLDAWVVLPYGVRALAVGFGVCTAAQAIGLMYDDLVRWHEKEVAEAVQHAIAQRSCDTV